VTERVALSRNATPEPRTSLVAGVECPVHLQWWSSAADAFVPASRPAADSAKPSR